MQVAIHQKDDMLIAGLAGDWELERPTPRFHELLEEGAEGRMARRLGFDTTELGSWDSSLLTFLFQRLNYCETHGLEFTQDGLPQKIARLLELARAVPEAKVEEKAAEVGSLLARIGTKSLAS